MFLAKSSIIDDLFSDLLREKRDSKYVLSTKITLKDGIMQLIGMILKQFILILKQ